MQILFKVVRQQAQQAPQIQTYSLDVIPSTTILDCLNQIKWEQDGTLAFRKNCRNTICGSCGIRVNGRAALACKETVENELTQSATITANMTPGRTQESIPEIVVAPMGNMPVIKDLIVDMSGFWQNYRAIDPYISTAGRSIPEREFLQSPQDRAKLDQMGNCILCGACYSDCNALESQASFVGPHALAKAHRTILDTRDQTTAKRLEQYNTDESGVWGCTRCLNCNAVCPMDVAPLDQISQIKSQLLASGHGDAQLSRSIRHRRVLVDLVKQGGWIDERQFGLRVLGNGFRDWGGILSLLPLGWRMLLRGKFPSTFEPSGGTTEVRALINSVKMLETKSATTMSETDPDIKTKTAPPEGEPTPPEAPGFGWTVYAERINGRFAMIGFAGLLILEWVTHQDVLTWLGLR